MLPGIAGIAGAKSGVTPLTLAYTGRSSNTADASSYTYSNAAIGMAANDRHIIVAVVDAGPFLADTPGVTSVTVAGQACTKLADAEAPGYFSTPRITIWITNAPVTSGTTASIVVSLDGTAAGSSAAVWAVYGLSSTTPYDTVTATGVAPMSGTIDYPDGGILIAAAGFAYQSTGVATWTGATEDFEGTDGRGFEYTGASQSNLSPASGQTISVTHSLVDSDPTHAMVAVTWAP